MTTIATTEQLEHATSFVQGTFKEVFDRVIYFLWDCSTAMIPTNETVSRWADALEARGPGFESLVKECRDWVKI